MNQKKNKIKILLINPPVAKHRANLEIPNIGLAYIAASLLEEGYYVKILDWHAYRLSKRDIKRILKETEYDIYGIGCMIVAYDNAVFLSKIIKKYHPSSLIIAGNSIASSIPELLLKTSKIDIAVIGEGELIIKEIAEMFLEEKKDYDSVAGIYYKNSGKIIKTAERKPIEDLDSLPFPALQLFPMKKYLESNKKGYGLGSYVYPICATRGCPFNCTFCYHSYQGYKVRRHSTERIIQEIKIILSNYKDAIINFVDDNFTYSKKLVYEFCDTLEKENLNIKWIAASRVNVIDEPLIKRMKESGCIYLGFGIESGSPTILKNVKKNATVEQARNALHLCKKYEIYASCSFMIGNLGENYKTAMETYNFIKEVGIKHNFRFFLPIPFPKTEIYEYAKRNDLIKNEIKLIKSFKSEENNLIRVNYSKLSDRKLIKLKISLEKILNSESHQFVRNYYIDNFISRVIRITSKISKSLNIPIMSLIKRVKRIFRLIYK